MSQRGLAWDQGLGQLPNELYAIFVLAGVQGGVTFRSTVFNFWYVVTHVSLSSYVGSVVDNYLAKKGIFQGSSESKLETERGEAVEAIEVANQNRCWTPISKRSGGATAAC